MRAAAEEPATQTAPQKMRSPFNRYSNLGSDHTSLKCSASYHAIATPSAEGATYYRSSHLHCALPSFYAFNPSTIRVKLDENVDPSAAARVAVRLEATADGAAARS